MLNDMRIKTRLLSLLAILLSGIVLVGGIGLYASNKLNKSKQSILDDRMMPVVHLYTIHTANLNNVLAISKAIAHPENLTHFILEIEENKSSIDRQWKLYTTIIQKDARDVEEDKILTNNFAEARRRFFEDGIKPAIAAMRVNNLDEVKRIQVELILPLSSPLHESLNFLINMEVNEAQLAHEEGDSLFKKIVLVSTVFILLTLTLGSTLGFFIIRGVDRSVSELSGVMAQMSADGNLGTRAKVYRHDEIGKVTEDFNALIGGINNLSELKEVFDNLDDGLVFIDQQRRILAINEAASRLLGQKSDTALNKLCPDVFQGFDCAKDCKNNDHCTRVVEAEQGKKINDIFVRRQDGALVNLRMSAIGLPSKVSLVLRGVNW